MEIYYFLFKAIGIILLLILLFWKMWLSLSKKRALKIYGKQKRKGGELGNEGSGYEEREPRAEAEPSSVVGYDESERGQLLPKAEPSIEGERSESPRRNSDIIKKFLRRAKK